MSGDIYNLLPAHIRTSDAEAEGVLQALFALMEREGAAASGNLVHRNLPAMGHPLYRPIARCSRFA
jgi:hypothetical protein